MEHRTMSWAVSISSSLLGLLLLVFYSDVCLSHPANNVWFEFRDNGYYRVYVSYTIPEIKELRDIYVDFAKKKDAEAFYWNAIRGGDFHRPNPQTMHFHEVPKKPTPW